MEIFYLYCTSRPIQHDIYRDRKTLINQLRFITTPIHLLPLCKLLLTYTLHSLWCRIKLIIWVEVVVIEKDIKFDEEKN